MEIYKSTEHIARNDPTNVNQYVTRTYHSDDCNGSIIASIKRHDGISTSFRRSINRNLL